MDLSKGRILLSLLFMSCLVAGSAQATTDAPLLDPWFTDYPLVFSTNVKVDYDPTGGAGGNGRLTASGWTYTYTALEGTAVVDVFGDFNLDVDIVPSTGVAVSGNLTVTGVDYWTDEALETGLEDGNLFSSNELALLPSGQTAFGSGAEDKFEFIFVQDGDMLVNDETYIGVVIWAYAIDAFNVIDPFFTVVGGTWQNYDPLDDDGDYPGESDTFHLPEPTTLIVLAMAGGLAVVRRRRPHEL